MKNTKSAKVANFINKNPNKTQNKKSYKTKISFNFLLIYMSLLTLISTLITPIYSIEIKEITEARFRFASKMPIVSNNRIRLDFDKNSGFKCIATDFIKEKEDYLNIPKSMTISPLSIFPFKFEIAEILMKHDKIKNSLKNTNKLATYLLVFQYLIYKYLPRDTIDKYIRDNELTDYYDYKLSEPDKQIFDSFNEVNNVYNYEDYQVEIMNRLKISLDVYEFTVVFMFFFEESEKYAFGYLFSPLAMEFKEVKKALSLISSRGILMHLNTYLEMEGIKENDPKHSNLTKKNIQLNRLMANVGVPSFIGYLDMCNHIQPQNFNEINRNKIELIAKKGFIVANSKNNYRPGDEILFNHLFDPTNISLMLTYGFVLKKNVFDGLEIKINDKYQLNQKKINLCKEISCSLSENNQKDVPEKRKEFLDNNKFNHNILNYGRVGKLPEKFDSKLIQKKLLKDKFISYSNEMGANIFYFQTVFESLKSEENNLMEIFSEGSNIKKTIKNIEDNYEEKIPLINKWRKSKVAELIYDGTLLLKNILIVHTNKILDLIITKTAGRLEEIRKDYLNRN
jgi:hypothetical protein